MMNVPNYYQAQTNTQMPTYQQYPQTAYYPQYNYPQQTAYQTVPQIQNYRDYTLNDFSDWTIEELSQGYR